MRRLEAVQCDFLGENRLGAGPVEIELSSPVSLLYAQVTVRRKTLQIAKIRVFLATRTTTHNISGKIRLFFILYVNIYRSMLR